MSKPRTIEIEVTEFVRETFTVEVEVPADYSLTRDFSLINERVEEARSKFEGDRSIAVTDVEWRPVAAGEGNE
ncbi:hypothetical protein [Chromobacterium phragmitis]|uniref:Uncharacterized protein n=1 Tax=Chromobacterium phragmitis TaxID=2202141 RepID=A0ABV0J2R5_9NEIS